MQYKWNPFTQEFAVWPELNTDGTLSEASDEYFPSQKSVKTYVDSKELGLVWHNPLELINVIGNASSPQPAVHLDGYIIDVGGATGAWSSFSEGDLVQYQTDKWVLIKSLVIGDRFGIAFISTTTLINSCVGKKNYLVQITGGVSGNFIYTFEINENNDAVFVQNLNAFYHGVAFTYTSTLNKWIPISGISFDFQTGFIVEGNHIALDMDTDPTLFGNSDTKVTSQKAIKSYVDNGLAVKVDKSTKVNGHLLSSDVTVTKSDVGLSNVDNTSDVNKPISTSQQSALDSKTDKTTTVNGHALSGNVSVTKSDVGLSAVPNLDTTSAVADDHTHANKALLDTYTQTDANLADAVSKKHSHVNETALDAVSGINTGDQDLSGKVDKTTTVNGHALSTNINVTKSDVGLSAVPNLDTTSAVADDHTHSNKSLLDTYTQIEANLASAVSLKHATHSDDETTTSIGSLINGATTKATPVDADQIGLMDSAASNILKKLSWVNIKATLKTYFDTLYQPLFSLTSVSGTYSVLSTDYTINCTSNSFTVTLLTAIGNTGKVFNIKNSGIGVITIATTSAQTIDGNASGILKLSQYDNLTIQSNGSNWIIL